MLRTLLVGPALALLGAATLQAQAAAPTGRAPATQAISINPLYLPLGGFVVEYEAAAAPGVSVGLSGGYYDLVGDDGDTYASAEAKLRFYPGERAPRGFSVGLSIGVGRATNDVCCDVVPRDSRTQTGATAGAILDYNWLLGRNRRFFVGTGIGAKRLFGDLGNNSFFDIEVLPTARLQVGAAF